MLNKLKVLIANLRYAFFLFISLFLAVHVDCFFSFVTALIFIIIIVIVVTEYARFDIDVVSFFFAARLLCWHCCRHTIDPSMCVASRSSVRTLTIDNKRLDDARISAYQPSISRFPCHF